ncbi:hypothetical protein H4217_008925 [Coemansia sp. RSA 1939]|nr:hypothetical protein H4217_008925 [Coemansia sp. RSA 1939]
MELYPGEFCTPANELFREYALYSNLQPLTSMPHDALVELPLAKFRLSDLATGHFNRDALLSLALYAGYLTVRSSTTVGIPNGELRCVWESILARMLLHSTSDMTLLHSTANVRNAFGMVVEFKHILDDQVGSSRAGRGKAKRGFKQISDKHYNMTMARCVECIHIGMSIGRGVVHAESQLYKRDSSDSQWIEVDTLL